MKTATLIKTTAATLISALTIVSAAACDAEEFVDETNDTQLRPGPPPWQLNTIYRNGTALPGIDLTGAWHHGHGYLGAEFLHNGAYVSADSIEVVDGELRAHYGGQVYGGDELDDAHIYLTGTIDPDFEGFAPLTTMSVTHELDDNGEHVYLLRFGETGDVDDDFDFVCADDGSASASSNASARRYAYLMRDIDVSETGEFSERLDTMYMACVSGAIGKLGQWGYYRHDLSLPDMQTLTRATRKDLCGDGVSYTSIGANFFVKDTLGVNAYGKLGPQLEAFWGPDGATCQGATSREDQVGIPSCYTDLPACAPPHHTSVVTLAPEGGGVKLQ